MSGKELKIVVVGAGAMGLQVEPMAGLDYYGFLGSKNAFSQLRRHLVIRFIGFKYRRLKSSSLQSLERGKPTEISYLNGYICDKGKEHGVKTPINDKIVEIIHDIEAGKKKITIDNFNVPAFDL